MLNVARGERHTCRSTLVNSRMLPGSSMAHWYIVTYLGRCPPPRPTCHLISSSRDS